MNFNVWCKNIFQCKCNLITPNLNDNLWQVEVTGAYGGTVVTC